MKLGGVDPVVTEFDYKSMRSPARALFDLEAYVTRELNAPSQPDRTAPKAAGGVI